MKNINGTLLLVAVFLCAGHAAAQIPEKDTQSWTDMQLTIPMTKQVDFLLLGHFRIGDNLTGLVDRRFGFGFNYKHGKYLTLSQSLMLRDATPPNGRPEREQRLALAATVKFPLGKFSLSERNQFERRLRAPQTDFWRYRNRIQLEHPFTVSKKKFNFFIADEVFYDFLVDDWVRNRASIGASHAFNKHFTGELYYLRQNDGRSRPGDLHVIGTALKFKL